MSTFALNKKARHNYEILETVEAGLKLTGAEVKSVKEGNISIKEGYIKIKNTEGYLSGAHIGKYKPAGAISNYDPTRERKLLLNRKELDRLISKLDTKGLTIVPLKVYSKGNLVKIEIALVRGKKQHEKRESIKKKDVDRQIRARLKSSLQ